MWYFFAILTLLIVGVVDGHFSSVAALFLLFVLGFLSVNSIKKDADKNHGGKVFGVVFSTYVLSAFIASMSFWDGKYFYVVDSMKYIEDYGNISTWSWDETMSILENQYFFFDDNNGLFNQSLALWAYIANQFFDGTSVFYLTLFQTLFGILASLEIYKIYLLYFETSKAVKYSLIFAVLSLFHIYSIVIIRDIVIAYFYMLGLRKVIGRPHLSDILILLLVMIATMGVRLYTGLFFGAFIMFWLYKLLQDKKYAKLSFFLIPIIVVGIAFVGVSLASSLLMESTTTQLEEYDDLYSDSGGGVVTKLRSLPMGVRQIVILFVTQAPLNDLKLFTISDSFSNVYLAILSIIYQIFGFVIFYGLMYYCFYKGLFKKMNFNEKWILIIMLIFVAITLSTHTDLRRSMEAVPFFFLFYLLLAQKYNPHNWIKLNRILLVTGFMIMITYSIIKM